MTEFTHAMRYESARQMSFSFDYLVRFWCKRLDIDYDGLKGSPTMVIWLRQEELRQKKVF